MLLSGWCLHASFHWQRWWGLARSLIGLYVGFLLSELPGTFFPFRQCIQFHFNLCLSLLFSTSSLLIHLPCLYRPYSSKMHSYPGTSESLHIICHRCSPGSFVLRYLFHCIQAAEVCDMAEHIRSSSGISMKKVYTTGQSCPEFSHDFHLSPIYGLITNKNRVKE